MLINKNLLLCIILWFPLQVSAFVQAEQEKTQAQIDQIMEISGINAMINQMPALVESQVRNISVFSVNEIELAQFTGLARDIFASPRLYDAIAKSLYHDYDAKKYQSIIEALNSPLARRMTQLELETAEPGVRDRIIQYVRKTHANIPAQRLQLIHELNDASGMIEAMVDVRLGWYESLVRSQNPLLPPDQRISEAELFRTLKDLRPQVMNEASEWLLMNGLYAYRNVDDRELRQYVDLYQSDAFHWFSVLANRALLNAYKEANEAWAKGVAELLMARQRQRSE